MIGFKIFQKGEELRKIKLAIVSFLSLALGSAFAAGPHDGITCLGCHDAHFAVAGKIFAVNNTQVKNPLTGESLDNLAAPKCLGCHQVQELGGAGIRPIHLHTTHPIGIKPNPKIADVPNNLLNDGLLDCVSCHEAHPSNNNFMYLRVDTGKTGEKLQNFCAACHSSKADLKSMGVKDANELQIFSAMDQSQGAKAFPRASAVINNKTKDYITPLGENSPNDLTPNYQNPPAWVYSPDLSRVKDGSVKAPAKKPAAK